jgi:two-component system response regulator DegU
MHPTVAGWHFLFDGARMIRIVIVDDHTQTRKLIRQLLEKREDWQVVAEGSDGHEAIQHTRTHEPHIVLLDIQMPRMDGFEATRQILKESPRVLILIISIHDGPYFAEASRSLGAKGFLPKVHLPYKLIPAVETILNGGSHFPGDVAAIA